jgi:hypothetical protein
VQIGDRRQAETLVGLPGQLGDLFVGDRHYGKRDNLVAVDALQAATLLRFSLQHCRLEQADGTPFAVIPWLQAKPQEEELCKTASESRCVCLPSVCLPKPPNGRANACWRARR